MKILTKNWILIVLAVFSLTPLIWFFGKEGYLINGVDTNFPLDPVVWFQRRFFVWNSVANAGGDFSSSVAGAFFHLIQVIPTVLGFNLQATQIISLVFWFSLIIFSSYTMAKAIFSKNVLIQILFVVLYSLNIYLFNTWENVKVANLALVSGIPFGIYLLLMAFRGKLIKIKLGLYSFFLGIVLSGSGINPSYFISFWIVVFIFFISDLIFNGGFKGFRLKFENFSVFSIFILLANAFWLLPTLNYIFSTIGPSGSIDKIGFTNWVQSLSENTSLLNVMRLQGAWDWYAVDTATGLALYIPYATNFFLKLPFILFSFLITTLAILSFLVAKRGMGVLYSAFGLMFLVGVFLGSGTHPPTGFLFNWLFRHLPFFSLFRSPWYIFTPMTFLSLAGLTCLFLYNFKSKRLLINFFVGILLVGNLFYSYPLITGKIFRPLRYDSFFVEFPDYVFEAQKFLKDADLKGRIIGYPDDEIERFEWGFTGIESILGLMIDGQTLFSSLNSPDAPVSRMIKDFYVNLKKGELNAAKKLAGKLNAEVIFEKRDQESLSPKLPSFFASGQSKTFGSWVFHKIPDDDFLGMISSAQNVYFGYPKDNSAKILQIIGKNDVLLNPDDTVGRTISEMVDKAGVAVVSQNSQANDLYDFLYTPSILSNRLSLRNLSFVEYSFEILKDGIYKPVLERYKLEEFGLSTRSVSLTLDGEPVEWFSEEVTDSYIRFGRQSFKKGKHVVKIALNSKDLVREYKIEGEGQFTEEEASGKNYLSIFNKSQQDIFASFPVSSFDPMSSYIIQFGYQQIYGNNAQVLMSQGTSQTLVKSIIERLPNYPEWNYFSFYFDPVKTQSTLSVKLAAPWTKDPLGTKVRYDDLSVHKVFKNDLILVEEKNVTEISSPKVRFEKKSPVMYEAEVSGAKDPHILVFSENYSPIWVISLQDSSGGELQLKPLHFSANLYANAWYIEGAPENYRVRIYYKRQTLFNIGVFLTVVSGLAVVALTWKRFLKNSH